MKKQPKTKALPTNAVAEKSVHLGYSGTERENQKLIRRARQEGDINRTTLMKSFIAYCLKQPVNSIPMLKEAPRGRAATNNRQTNAVASKVITGANGARTATARTTRTRRTRKATAAGAPNTMAAAVGGTTEREVF